MSILDRLLRSDDGGDDADDELLFDDGDDFDELGGGGEFADDLEFGEDDDAGGSTRELESRVDELENELSSLSSTVGTIKSENEEIANTVDDVEENVRKLLDIYEMVTRGVNPFVDDVQSGGDFDGGGGSLGLFDADDDDADDADEQLDESLAGADAEDFFDDDFLDDDSVGATGSDAGDADDSGKSFEELKNEYDAGDADWATDDARDGFDEGDDLEASVTTDDPIANGAATDPDPGATEAAEAGSDDAERAAEPPADPAARASPDSSAAAAQSAGDLQFAENTLMAGSGPRAKPYLDALPAGFVVDLLVLEWIEFLVEESDPTDAARAVEYYRTVEWISDDVADGLRNFLRGFGDVDADSDEVRPNPTSLTLDHHVDSLRYVSRLTSGTSDALLFERSLEVSDGI
ncbi:FlaD/FlaE family flagellar protein [Salinirarus marinus]|uniref:FlaD/FlaE family flagellar protein n=1 Tax=Salinirarus marinus TaxID=3068310 RepID=UPI003C6C4F3C